MHRLVHKPVMEMNIFKGGGFDDLRKKLKNRNLFDIPTVLNDIICTQRS